MGNEENVPSGTYLVEILGLPADSYLESATYDGRDVRNAIVNIDRPGHLELVVAGPGGLIEGVVRDEKGGPASDATAVLVPLQDRREDLTLFKTAITDAAGAFAIRGLPPGEYGLIAWRDITAGAFQNGAFMRKFEARLVRTTVRAGLPSQAQLRLVVD
jgi:hypothetical protein